MDLSEDRSRLDYFLRKRRRLDPAPSPPLREASEPPPSKQSRREDDPAACQTPITPSARPQDQNDVVEGSAREVETPDHSASEDLDTSYRNGPGEDFCGSDWGPPSEGSPGRSGGSAFASPPLELQAMGNSPDTGEATKPCREGGPGWDALGATSLEMSGVELTGFRRPIQRRTDPPKWSPEMPGASAEVSGCGGVVSSDCKDAVKLEGGPVRADSDKSSMGHWDGEGVVDLEGIDVCEQQNILRSIAEARLQREKDIAKSLMKGRQASIAAFLRR
jgi:hypothetical protein